MWDNFLERWVFIRSPQWDIFCGKKLGKLDHKKRSSWGSIDAEFGDHFSHDLSLKRDEPICLSLAFVWNNHD